MAQEEFYSTLAFTKSPKTSKRTTFQDELEAAVSKRAVRNRASYLNFNIFNDDDDDDDDDDDVLKELLKTRRNKRDLFKASRTKTSINDFKLSDEEEENIKPKKVSFLKSQRNADSLRSDTLRSDTLRSDRSLVSHQSVNEVQGRDRSQQDSYSDSPAPQNSQSESPPCRRSQSESPLPLYSENSQRDSISESVLEATPPTPAPRHRAPPTAVSGRDENDGQTKTPSRIAASSPVSKPCTSTSTFTSTFTSPSMSSQTAEDSGIDGRQDDVSVMVNTHSRSLEGAESSDFSVTEHEEHQEHQLTFEVSPGTSRSAVSRPGSSRKSRSTPSFNAEPRYLGTLKVLEQKFQETGLENADSLRATVYQDWRKKKEEKLQETFRAKKQEEKLKEEKKTEEEASKKAEAKASYEAWKEKKREALKEKIREKQEAARKLQKEMDEKKEKNETAKRIFEKWKREHDELLCKEHQKRAQTEYRLKENKVKEKEQRKRESSSSFAQWSARKKEVIEEKLKAERRQKEVKEIEEKYEKEEKEKSALDMYEEWLKRKEFQQKQERREKQKKADAFQEATPPWSPPNRTIPFGK